ncbi:MAG: alcohol dehydrogenase catalytic domain-containing protein [Spirochaetota bacterium]|nr:MAG: alcohol dehydrogenase catalytic domain-containing protein [Spirochaetota bacterium]
MEQKMKAAVVEKPKKIVIKEVPVPDITDDEILIKIKYTGICGTDWSIYTGKYSADKLPLIPGHEFSGIVAKVGKNAKDLKEGEPVTADINMSCGHCFYCRRGQKLMCPEFTQLGIHINGTYAEYAKAPWEQVHKLPKTLDLLKGAFIEPTSCVIHSAKAMEVDIGSSVAIIGSGLGSLHAAVAKHRGAAPIIVMGRNEVKLKIAKQLGADYTINVNKKDPVKEVIKLTEGRGADYVIEAAGTAKTYEQAFEMVRPGGRIAAFGITGVDDIMRIKPFELVIGERSIVSSCAGVGTDWNDAIALLQYNRINPEPFFSMIVPLEELETALHELRTDKNLFKVFVSLDINKRKIL